MRGDEFCPRCGSPLSRRRLASSRVKAALAGLLCLLLAGGVVLALLAVSGKYVSTASQSVKTEPTAVTLGAEPLKQYYSTGDEIRLTPEFYPEESSPEKLSWVSSDESVAMIAGAGLVRVVGRGEAVVSAVTDNGVTGSFTVRAYIRPESLSFSERETAVPVGGEFTPELTVQPKEAGRDDLVFEFDEDMLELRGEGTFRARRSGRTRITARTGELSAALEVFVYRHKSEMLADLIMREGERDLESQCFYYVVDNSRTVEDGLSITKYVELIYFPDSGITTLCCDIYDSGLKLYYETNVIFTEGNTQLASVTFQCSLEAASGSHTVPLGSSSFGIYGEGRISLGEYRPGDPIKLQIYEGSTDFRESAEAIMRSMTGYSVSKLGERWLSFGLPFTMGETLGFAED